jgi:hypothetical protein
MVQITNLDGELVVDATGPLKFTVTPSDVSTGQPRLARDCPGNHGVCRALKSVLPAVGFHDIRIHLTRTYVRMPGVKAAEEFGAKVPPEEKGNFVWLRFANAKPLRDQVYSMDTRKKFEPGEYSLWKPDPPPPTRHHTKEAIAKMARATRGQRQASLSGVRKWKVNR